MFPTAMPDAATLAALRERSRIDVVYDRSFRVWFACHIVGGRNQGSIAHGKTEADATRMARLMFPDIQINTGAA